MYRCGGGGEEDVHLVGNLYGLHLTEDRGSLMTKGKAVIQTIFLFIF